MSISSGDLSQIQSGCLGLNFSTFAMADHCNESMKMMEIISELVFKNRKTELIRIEESKGELIRGPNPWWNKKVKS